MIIALCDGPALPPERGFILDLRWLWHSDYRPTGNGPYMVPTILFKGSGPDYTYSPTIMRMHGDERPSDLYILPVNASHQSQYAAVIRATAKAYRKILKDPSMSAARFEHWMKSKDPLFEPEPFDRRELVTALSMVKMLSDGLAKRHQRVDCLRKILGSNAAVNEDQLRKLEKKLLGQ